jgi:hypothetical protein
VRVGAAGIPMHDARWRLEGAQRMRRIGPAWVERDGDGWKTRRGRPQPEYFTEEGAVIRTAPTPGTSAPGQ